VPGSPAAEAGVQELDVITAFDDQPVEGTRALQEIVERSAIGKPHKLTVFRDGKQLTLSVAVKPLPSDLAQAGPGRGPRAEAGEETYFSKEFGIEVRDKASVADDAYEGFTGVLVDRVDSDGLAAEAGIGPGVLVRAVGRTEVKTIADFAAAIEKETAAEGVVLKVRTPRGNAVVLLQRK
jgi:serine protease Do